MILLCDSLRTWGRYLASQRNTFTACYRYGMMVDDIPQRSATTACYRYVMMVDDIPQRSASTACYRYGRMVDDIPQRSASTACYRYGRMVDDILQRSASTACYRYSRMVDDILQRSASTACYRYGVMVDDILQRSASTACYRYGMMVDDILQRSASTACYRYSRMVDDILQRSVSTACYRYGRMVFMIGFHTMPGQHNQPTLASLGQLCVHVFRCNLPPALLAEWLGSFMCHCSNTGVEWAVNESALKVNSEEENSAVTSARIRTRNLLIESLALYQVIPAPSHLWRWQVTGDKVRSNPCSNLMGLRGQERWGQQ